MDLVITGASRGIGRALALELARRRLANRLILVARNGRRLAELESEVRLLGGQALAVTGDLSSRTSARALAHLLAGMLDGAATLVHNAGLWPARRELNDEGLERAFVTNFVGPVLLQRSLAARGKVRRTLVIGAGAMVLGRVDPARTPTGEDFSALRTYCTTKLCLALALRDFAQTHPGIDVAVVHPGVIRTELGARAGILGFLLRLMKRRWESPESAAVALARLLSQQTWGTPGDAPWFIKEEQQPWPTASETASTRRAVRELAERYAAV